MKKIILFLLLAVVISTAYQATAQVKQRFGHIDSQALLMKMPERETAKKAIEAHAKELEEQLQAMQKELELKYQDYLDKQATYSDLIKKTKEEELTDLQQRMQDFQATAQQDLQSKELELLQPIFDKAKKGIEDVAKEKGYDYVFDTSVGALLYWPPESDDLLPMVLKKLGIE
ncbi:MAG: OmpH family outer membrane protein [Bacteroidota bacterium]